MSIWENYFLSSFEDDPFDFKRQKKVFFKKIKDSQKYLNLDQCVL